MSNDNQSHESNIMEEQYDEGMLCERCHLEEPMYPCKDSVEDCSIFCADCYWDLDAERKRKRRSYWKHCAEILAANSMPLSKEENKIETK